MADREKEFGVEESVVASNRLEIRRNTSIVDNGTLYANVAHGHNYARDIEIGRFMRG